MYEPYSPDTIENMVNEVSINRLITETSFELVANRAAGGLEPIACVNAMRKNGNFLVVYELNLVPSKLKGPEALQEVFCHMVIKYFKERTNNKKCNCRVFTRNTMMVEILLDHGFEITKMINCKDSKINYKAELKHEA